jgi:hypothetical protein
MVQQDAHERMHKSGGLHVSRRTVARGMAWSVPAVAVATAAPAFAVSRIPPDLLYTGACKFPGLSCRIAPYGYALTFAVTNNDARPLAFCSATLTIEGDNPFGAGVVPVYTGGCFTVGGGASGDAVFYFAGAQNSANSNFSGTITIRYANNCASCDSDSAALPPIPYTVTDTPPDKDGLCDCLNPWIPD